MKKIATFLILFCLISTPIWLFSQAKCKVLLPAISDSYQGKCKKGYANGKGIAKGIDSYDGRFRQGYPDGNGTYTWASGNEYVGEWDYGKRHGVGIYKFKFNGKDSIQSGLWNEDKYMGPVPPPPFILQSRNIQQYSFYKRDEGNKLSIEIFINGAINSTIEDLSIVSTNGSYQNLGRTIVFDYLEFPVTMKITYRTWNKLHTDKYDAVFEFKMSEPGDWRLKLTN